MSGSRWTLWRAAKVLAWSLAGIFVGLPVLLYLGFLGIQEASERQWLGKAPTHPAIDVRSREPHTVALLDVGFDSLATRMRLIEEAKESIELEFFIYEVDTASRLVTQALARKAREGVKVRLLVDFALPVFKLAPHDRDRIFAAMYLIVGSILFWALFEQAGSSLNLFTDSSVDRRLLGYEVPASVFQSINAIYIVLLGPVFAGLWLFLGRRGLEPSSPAKFGLGVIQLGAGFLVLVAGSSAIYDGGLTPVLFIFLIYLLHTTGELCLSPVGLSAMNRLSPAHLASLIMGTWFFASASGNFVAGMIAAATGAEGVDNAGPERVLEVYTTVGWVAVAVGVGFMIVAPLIRRLAPEQVRSTELAGEAIQSILSHAPGNNEAIGGLKVITANGWFAARPSGTEDIYKIYAESFLGDAHLQRLVAEAQELVNAAIAPSAG